MASDGRDAIIFITRNLLYIYDANSILKLDIPAEVVRDMDILDKTGFDGLVDTFIKTKKIDPGTLWIVLSDDVCFSQEIAETDSAKLETEVRDFLEAVPFDQIISKRFKSQSGVRVIAANLELVEAIIEIFDRNGFETEAITPSAIFPGYGAKKVLDPDYARFIISNKALCRQGNMLARMSAPSRSPEPAQEIKKKNKLLPYLIVGFVVLLAILVVALVMRR